MLAYYGQELSPNQVETAEGYLICKNVPIARTGSMQYLARELGLEDEDSERLITVNRYPDDVFSPVAIASFEGKDVTDTHPPQNLDVNTVMSYSKGHVENVRRDGDFLVADLHIKDPALISDIQEKRKREVSCGYSCDFVPDGDGFKQINIRGNHVAVVPQGRAGETVAIKDSAESARKGACQEMSKKTNAILALFRAAAKDATPEALDELTENAATMLDDEPAVEAPESEPIEDVKVESVPKGDDLGSKLDRLIEMFENFVKKDEASDEVPVEPEEPHDESCIDAEIENLEAGETEAEKEEAVTVPMDCATRDASVAILKAVRPAIAEMKDPAEKQKVVDAFLSAVRPENTMSKVMKANENAAKTALDSIDPNTRIGEIQDNYNVRNPHYKKED